MTLANSVEIPVKEIGILNLNLRTSTDMIIPVTIQNVLYLPELKGRNLLSESKLELEYCKIVSENGQRKVFKDGNEWLVANIDSSRQYIIQEQK